MNKENWINDIIQSGKEIRPIPANPFLATRVEARLQQLPNAVTPKIPIRWVYSTAITLVVLLVLNILVWQSTAPQTQTAGVQQLIQEYGWSNNDLYSMNFSK
jgi:hypothetical protein